jgi:hypothetical protein
MNTKNTKDATEITVKKKIPRYLKNFPSPTNRISRMPNAVLSHHYPIIASSRTPKANLSGIWKDSHSSNKTHRTR